MNTERLKITWKMFGYYEPIRIIITDWNNLHRIGGGRFLLAESMMEYKERMILLCVPYYLLVNKVLKLHVDHQRWIKDGKAVIEVMKTYKNDNHGMVIRKVELYTPSP